MASVRKHKSSSIWYACVTYPDGRRRQFSTGLTDRDEALAVAVATERSARKHHERPHQLRAALDRLAADFIPPEDIDPGPWLLAWAASRKAETSTSTANLYAQTAKETAAFLGARSIHSFAALTPALLTDLRTEWAARNAPRTVNSKLKHLRIALKTAIPHLIDHNPASQVGAIREGRVKRREFRPAELQVLLPALHGEWRAITFLGLYTGQRLNDLAELRWHQVDLAGATITFTTAKTSALVALPLLPPAIAALADLPSSDSPLDPVFPVLAGMPKSTRSNAFRSILASVGLAKPLKHRTKATPTPHRESSELSFHSLRHTATSMLKAAGVTDSIARAIVGHQSAAVSRAYTHLDLDTMRLAMEKMPSL